jgi:phage gp46-like protein
LSTPDPARPAEPLASKALEGYAVVLAPLALALAGLVVALATRNPRVALMQVLPTVVAMLLAGGATALWLLRRPAFESSSSPCPLWLVMLGPALATTAALLATVLLMATLYGRLLGHVLVRPVVERGLLGAPLLGALVGAGLWQLERARQRERAAWQAEQDARNSQQLLQHAHALAQLQLLQAQIEPHFIYNTLANLRQLVRLDSARALQMLDSLIRYFKLVLPSFRAVRLPLQDELALVQAYMDLLRERMGREMQLQIDVPDALSGISLLPGALLCLAENAIKHGLPEDGSALLLQISARQAGGTLILAVRDNGAGPSATPRPGGTGLGNLRERLRLLYGTRASLALYPARPGCEAMLTLPWEMPAAPFGAMAFDPKP